MGSTGSREKINELRQQWLHDKRANNHRAGKRRKLHEKEIFYSNGTGNEHNDGSSGICPAYLHRGYGNGNLL